MQDSLLAPVNPMRPDTWSAVRVGSRHRSVADILPLTALRLILVAALSVSAVPCAQAQAESDAPPREPVLASDLLKLRQLGSVTVSPDGREVVYTVTSITGFETANLSEADNDSLDYRTHLYLADASGTSTPRQLTRGTASASDPAWHPNGDRIAFVRRVDGTPQIFVLPLHGGEAVQVTSIESGASNPDWSPDGSRILFASSLSEVDLAERLGHGPPWPRERPGRSWGDAEGIRPNANGSVAEIRAWLDRNARDGDPRVIHRLDFQSEHDLEPDPDFRHYFVVRTDTTAESVMITAGFHDFGRAAWLPDGEQIIVSGLMQADAHPDRLRDSGLYLARADGGGVEPLLEMDGYSVSDPKPSPDGRQIAFLARSEEDWGYAQTELGVFAIDSPATARLLTLDFDRSVSGPQWARDGWYVYFTAASDGGVPLYRLHPFDTPAAEADTTAAEAAANDTTAADAVEAIAADTIASDTTRAAPADAEPDIPIERLTSFERGVHSFDASRATVFYVATSLENPYELYASNLPFTSETQLTTHNADWLDDKRLSHPERRSLTRDGFEIDYWIMRPTAFDSTRSYPLLVQMHGGPSAMWGPGEASMWHEFQFFASKGYVVVYGNPRGSGGYGYDFKRANYQDWGAGPAQDVLAIADEAAELPWVDADRQVLTGGSYAGYLTAWIVAHDDRFQAAVAQRGVYDLDTFLGEGNAWRLVPAHFGGFPWETTLATDELSFPDAPQTIAPAAADTTDMSAADTTDAVTPDTSDALARDTTDALTSDTADVSAADTPALTESTFSDTSVVAPSMILDQNSPLTFVEQITTPLLIMHADDDLRTGVVQSEVLFRSLKILERPVEYVRYPDAGHDLSRTGNPRQRLDRILRIYEFFERFVR